MPEEINIKEYVDQSKTTGNTILIETNLSKLDALSLIIDFIEYEHGVMIMHKWNHELNKGKLYGGLPYFDIIGPNWRLNLYYVD